MSRHRYSVTIEHTLEDVLELCNAMNHSKGEPVRVKYRFVSVRGHNLVVLRRWQWLALAASAMALLFTQL